jgi:uncharacterized cupin superfamily protein
MIEAAKFLFHSRLLNQHQCSCNQHQYIYNLNFENSIARFNMDSPKAIVHENDVEWNERGHGERIGFRRKLLGQATGAQKLGCGLFEVAPGKRAWPFHYHFANEEAVYILAGSGTLRLGNEEFQLRPGHFVTFCTGPETAHQLINSGSETLRYLSFSTMISPEVGGYPDSGKFAILAGRAPAGSASLSAMRKCFLASSEVDYYEGEG